MQAIACRNLVKRYGRRRPVEAVRGIDLAVEVGECFGLLGPNGAGKTTTLEILEGLLPPTSGEVEVLGMRWGRHDRALRRRIGIALQETRLPDRLTVREVVGLFRSFHGCGPSVEELIRLVGLAGKENAWVRKLSGGQRQRLSLACALTGWPELLMLDEPTTGLDPEARYDLWEIIQRFRRAGKTVLLSTHYMEEAEQLCDRVAIMHQGRVVVCGEPAELISQLGGNHVIEFSLDQSRAVPEPLPFLRNVPRVHHRNGTFRLVVDHPQELLPHLWDWARRSGRLLENLSVRRASLDDVFLSVTGKHLQEADQKGEGATR